MKKWYQSAWIIIFALLIFFPVGLYLLWKYSGWKKSTKIAAIVATAFWVIFSFANTEQFTNILAAIITVGLFALPVVGIYRYFKNKQKPQLTAEPYKEYNALVEATPTAQTIATHPAVNLPNPANTKTVTVNQSPIPLDVFELLWFADGKYKNYDPKSASSNFNAGYGVSFSITMSGDLEPSALSLTMPVAEPKNLLFVEALPYYPTYYGMSSEQRWVFLNWLTNVDNLIDIGYVFVFYYGLERHLFSDKYENAFKMILRLRKQHKNSSFLSYSTNALLASLLFHKRADLFGEYLTNVDEIIISELYLYIKLLLEQPLFPFEIISQAGKIGFTNKRYINSDYDLFLSILTEKVKAQFGETFIHWNQFDMSKCQTRQVNIAANTSLKPRDISIPDLLTNRQLNKILLALLTDTHESVKEALKEQRKIKKT